MNPVIKKLTLFHDKTEAPTVYLSRREVGALLAYVTKLKQTQDRTAKMLKRHHETLGEVIGLMGGEQ